MFLEPRGWSSGMPSERFPRTRGHTRQVLSDPLSDRSCLRSPLISLPTLKYLCNCGFNSLSPQELTVQERTRTFVFCSTRCVLSNKLCRETTSTLEIHWSKNQTLLFYHGATILLGR